MDEPLARALSDLQTLRKDSQSPLSETTLHDLQSIFADVNLDHDAELLFSEMAERNIPLSSLVHHLALSMDSPDAAVALAASGVYLSALLAPSAPLYTLFTPLAFLSLLASLRRALKQLVSGSSSPSLRNEAGRKKSRPPATKCGHRSSGRASATRTDSQIVGILERLILFLSKVHLGRFSESLKSLVDTMAGMLVMGINAFENSAFYSRFSSLCFQILKGVLRSEHGDVGLVATQVLKALSPSILLLKSHLRTLALKFVTENVASLAKESDKIRQCLVIFPRYLIEKSLEKSDHRAIAVEAVVEIVKIMDHSDQIEFTDYVVKMSEGKIKLRLIAADLIPILLTVLPEPFRECEDSWGSRCLEALFRRCSDVSAPIRARSLSNLANVIELLSNFSVDINQVSEVLGFSDGKLNNLLKRRCRDEKAAVRKATLLLIMKSTSLLGGKVDEAMVSLISCACSDPLVSIRKAAVAALSEIFRKFSDSCVVFEWLHAVPRLITDNESSIQTECENLFQELVLDRVSRAGCHNLLSKTYTSNAGGQTLETELESLLSEGALNILKGTCDGQVSPYVKKICSSLGKKKKLNPGIVVFLKNIIRASEDLWIKYSRPIEEWTAPCGAWFLLSEVSLFLPESVDWKFLQHHWKLLDKNVFEKDKHSIRSVERNDDASFESVAWVSDRVYLLQTISNVAVRLPADPAADLAQDLLCRIEGFNMHFTEVNAHIKALRTLCKRKAAITEKGDCLVERCAIQLLAKALSIVDSYIKEVKQPRRNNFETPRCSSMGNNEEEKSGKSLSLAVTAVFTIGSLILVCPSVDTKEIVPILHTIITSGSSEQKAKIVSGAGISVRQVAPSLYIQSWLTMGKICLIDGKTAKRYIPLFVQELGNSDSAALRNNIIVVMADFCVRYTALVDCYIPQITNSLKDSCEVVRRQTFILLSRLLQLDYVKWRGILFLRFLVALVDESDKIRQLADFLFGNILRAKAPLLAYNSFIEAIFVLNDCRVHGGKVEVRNAQTGSYDFSIRGNDEKSRLQRMHVYVTLLKQMAPEHLLATSAKLCAEILAAASDGLLDLSDVTARSVLQDALQILACKEMRIQSNRGHAAESADLDEESENGGAGVSAAKGRLVTQAAKKNLIQNAIPIFIELKRLLESKNSPLTGCLMECLRVLLKDYKNEIDDILVADPQLKKELLYDMQKNDAAKAKSTAQAAVAAAQRPNGFISTAAVNDAAGNISSIANKADKSGGVGKIASAVADAAAEATARSVLKEINSGQLGTKPGHSMSIPKLKSSGSVTHYSRFQSKEVIESVRRKQSFDSDDEN